MKSFIHLSFYQLSFIFHHAENSSKREVVAKAEPFKPTNIYPVERLPLHFTRVVLLPCYHHDPDATILKFCDQVFFQELAQERIFEIIQLSTDDLYNILGIKDYLPRENCCKFSQNN